MPGQRCAVAACQSVHGKHKVSFFTIPKKKDIRSKWIKACKRKDKFNPDTSRVCSMHFREEDYKLDFRSSLLNIEMKRPRTLKPTAVPSVHLSPDDSDDSEELSPRDQRMQRRNRKNLVQSLLQQSNKENTLSELEVQVQSSLQQSNEENTLSELEVQPENETEQNRFDAVFDRYNVIFVEGGEEIDEDQKVQLKLELDSDVKREPISDGNIEESQPLEPSSEMTSADWEEIVIVETKIEVECDDMDEPQVNI